MLMFATSPRQCSHTTLNLKFTYLGMPQLIERQTYEKLESPTIEICQQEKRSLEQLFKVLYLGANAYPQRSSSVCSVHTLSLGALW